MIIRKLYRFEGAHIVRNCTSERCRENIHGHSYIVEIFVSSDSLDKGYMVTDFARLEPIKELIDSFDHSYSLWSGEDAEFKRFIYEYCKRVAEIPISPSAEGYALLFLKVADYILSHLENVNGEGEIKVQSVRVHETATGYAEAFRDDLKLAKFDIKDINFTDDIKSSWRSLKL